MADVDGTTFLTGNNAGFIAELYTRFLEDPEAVDESWRQFFSQMDDDLSAVLAESHGPSWGNPAPRIITNGAAAPAKIDVEELPHGTSPWAEGPRRMASEPGKALDRALEGRMLQCLGAPDGPQSAVGAGQAKGSRRTAVVCPGPQHAACLRIAASGYRCRHLRW